MSLSVPLPYVTLNNKAEIAISNTCFGGKFVRHPPWPNSPQTPLLRAAHMPRNALPLVVFLIAGWPSPSVAANTCGKALVLPLKNNTLSDGVVANRGVPVDLGGQSQGLRVTFSLNNTRVRNSRDCEAAARGNASAKSDCEGASGGVFAIDNTFVKAPDGQWKVTFVDPLPAGAAVSQGYDVATFTGGVKIQDFPFEVWSDAASTSRSAFALGRGSSVVSRFYDAGLVPSKVIGMFFGSRSMSRGVDGTLIFGGWDRSRVNGSWTNFTISKNYLNNTPCPLQVQVSNVELSGANGTHSLFADPGGTVSVAACVDPWQNQFSFTQSMYSRFQAFTNHPNNPEYTPQIYPLENEALIGNITIKLTNGYTSVIPHYELVSLERGTDAEGKYAVINSSRIMIAAGGDDIGIPILGGVFLAQNYLLLDYENNAFSLAPAVTGPMDLSLQDVVTICNHRPKDKSAIIGGVIGGIGFLLIIISATFYLLRRRPLRQPPPALAPSMLELE
ncbi:MAG: hypothetical protein M1839_006136 [Geoglossum umbratile]|nr:MAG: hypothetical protein M1839_006136 [Geoglossum umbratile]